MPTPDLGRLRQAAIYLRGLAGRRPVVPVDPVALETRAREVMSADAFADVRLRISREERRSGRINNCQTGTIGKELARTGRAVSGENASCHEPGRIRLGNRRSGRRQ